MVAIFLGISFITRTILLFYSLSEVDISFIQLLLIYGVGAFYDLVAASYYFIPFVLYIMLLPAKIFYKPWHKKFLIGVMFVITYFIIFNGVSEWFFWEEFGKRFNFIAVDYLVYTHEVIQNILESYPIPLLLSVILLLDFALWWAILKYSYIIEDVFSKRYELKQTFQQGILFLVLPIVFFFALDKQPLSKISDNIYNNELAKDGLYSLFSAFRHNTLEYDIYYKTKPLKEVMEHLYQLEKMDDKHLKVIENKGDEKHYNVVLVMIESMSAKYMGVYGDDQNLTPYLDALTQKSLFFDNLYATGTRTVRGMEAVTLSLPPTPGRSIVKRPDSHGMYSSGFIFEQKGYENKFIYGGYGYFDNMNDFFSHNGFKIVDRNSFSKEEETFGNVWGVCDEDLFNKALKEADSSYKNKKPFFQFIMTTSNHRPYTYPDGRIDIPSHSGRAGGVKYTDYAIKEFIENAKKKPWFKDTLFVIVADHNGGSAGKNTLPTWRYKIPFIVYAPEIIQPKTIHKLSSQIDVMPTIMGILNFSYKSLFYGNDILKESFKQRAFIGNYQKLGYLKNDILTVLFPDKTSKSYKIEKQTLTSVKYKDIAVDKELEEDTITYYQSASYFYDNGINRWEKWQK
ncbi:MAG: sulfatase-like hydrolase/transferase [Epsilonproteobacteria bacterium]|nr:sulfatase-like hydrolase/transferase [Campylobacterota bacterium]